MAAETLPVPNDLLQEFYGESLIRLPVELETEEGKTKEIMTIRKKVLENRTLPNGVGRSFVK